MYLPALARDLYKSHKNVEALENQFQEAVSTEDQQAVKEELRLARAELDQIKKIMEGKKEQSKSSINTPKPRFF